MKHKFKKIAAAVSSLMLAASMTVPMYAESAVPTAKPESKYVHGDVNLDGVIDVTDISQIGLALVDKTVLDDIHFACSDIDYDGDVNLVDYATLRQYVSKKITSLPEAKEVSYVSYEERKKAREAVIASHHTPEPSSPTPEVYNTPGYFPDETEEEGVVAAPVPTYIPKVFNNLDADGYLKFAAGSAAKVLVDSEDTRGKENPVYSPLSYYMALSMAAECASGNTRDEIVDVLGAEDIEDLRYENDLLYRAFRLDGDSEYCVVSNSAWLNSKWKFKQEAFDTLAKNYYATSYSRDFRKKEETEAEISDWVYKRTMEKIKPDILIKDPESDIVRLINAVAFKDTWEEEFDEDLTKKDNFLKRDGKKISCDFMKERVSEAKVVMADKFMMYSKEMKNGYTMNFVLPDEGVDINDILSDEEAVADIYAGNLDYKKLKVDFLVPKFEVVSEFNLMDATEELGIKEAFDDSKADFSTMLDYAENNLFNNTGTTITAIDHQAQVKIDEKGGEAEAYTQIVVGTTSPTAVPGQYLLFKLDRPFFYYISYKNNVPLFAGIIDNPNE